MITVTIKQIDVKIISLHLFEAKDHFVMNTQKKLEQIITGYRKEVFCRLE